jgi:hypothetical protein
LKQEQWFIISIVHLVYLWLNGSSASLQLSQLARLGLHLLWIGLLAASLLTANHSLRLVNSS